MGIHFLREKGAANRVLLKDQQAEIRRKQRNLLNLDRHLKILGDGRDSVSAMDFFTSSLDFEGSSRASRVPRHLDGSDMDDTWCTEEFLRSLAAEQVANPAVTQDACDQASRKNLASQSAIQDLKKLPGMDLKTLLGEE